MRLERYLKEEVAIKPGRFVVTLRDIKTLLYKQPYMSDDLDKAAEQIYVDIKDGTREERQSSAGLLKLWSKIGTKALKLVGDFDFYYKKEMLIKEFLNSYANTMTIKKNPEDYYWPVVLEITSDPNDEMSIGIIISKSGKKELYEGNDEASAETYDLVDEILGNIKPVTVYAQHGEKVVEKIRKTNTLPANIYVSPSRKYAEGYWSLEENRVMFSCEAMSNAFRKESDVDWKTKKITKIKKFKYM